MLYASLTLKKKKETETDEQGDQSPGRGAFKEPWIFRFQRSFRSFYRLEFTVTGDYIQKCA